MVSTASSKAKPYDLPTVSIVVTNYNYGSFIKDALASIAAQTFPNIETVVVDDLSTDNSWNLISELTAEDGLYPAMTAHRMRENSGHGVAAATGLSLTKGPYVIFLDADDVLLPTCVEAHIYAHLSSRAPMGFSSVDVYSVMNNEYVIASSGTDRASYIASSAGRTPGMLRPIEQAAKDEWFGLRPPTIDTSDIHLVPAPNCEWVWAPLSGNCFRRSALEMVIGDSGMDPIRSSVDNYFMYPIAAMCGSILIDKPLMAYRIHSNNTFIKSAPLDRLITFKADPKMDATRKAAVRKTFEIVQSRKNIFERPDYFFEAVIAQCEVWPRLMSDRSGGDFLMECMNEFRKPLSEAFGRDVFDIWLRKCRLDRKPAGRRSGFFAALRKRWKREAAVI